MRRHEDGASRNPFAICLHPIRRRLITKSPAQGKTHHLSGKVGTTNPYFSSILEIQPKVFWRKDDRQWRVTGQMTSLINVGHRIAMPKLAPGPPGDEALYYVYLLKAKC
jgi:hypothetical protein